MKTELSLQYGLEITNERYHRTPDISSLPNTSQDLAPHPIVYRANGKASPEDIASLTLGGDLSHLNFEQVLEFYNQFALKQSTAVEKASARIADPSLPDDERVTLQQQLEDHDRFFNNCLEQHSIIEDYVNDPSHYDSEAPERIQKRKILAHHFSEHFFSEELSAFYEKVYGISPERTKDFLTIVFLNLFSDGEEKITDMDDTKTQDASYYLRHIVPGGLEAEKKIDERKNSQEAILRTLPETRLGILIHNPEAFRWAGRHKDVPLRKGAENFFKDTKKVTVISASFLPFVFGVLDKIEPVHKGDVEVDVYAVSPEYVFSLKKDLIVSHIAKNNPTHVTKFWGDGSSDFTVTNSKELDYVWALEDSSLEKKLKQNGQVPYLVYKHEDNSSEIERYIRWEAEQWRELLEVYAGQDTSGEISSSTSDRTIQ